MARTDVIGRILLAMAEAYKDGVPGADIPPNSGITKFDAFFQLQSSVAQQIEGTRWKNAGISKRGVEDALTRLFNKGLLIRRQVYQDIQGPGRSTKAGPTTVTHHIAMYQYFLPDAQVPDAPDAGPIQRK